MRGIARLSLAIFFLSAAIVACSSSDDSSATAPCTIVGTYTMTVEIETQSEGCKDLPPDDGTPVIVTITSLDGDRFGLEFSGVQGGCIGTRSETCKLQTKCDITINDQPDGGPPKTVTATIQDSWTFNASGFTGLNAGEIPPLSSLPNGCSQTAKATGTRR